MSRRKNTNNIYEYFWQRVRLTPHCWEWIGDLDRCGYGRANCARLRIGIKTTTAHRLSWLLLIGAIPDGLQLDHLCNNTACVRPDHMEPVSPHVNCRRSKRVNAISFAMSTCPAGHERNDANTYRPPGRSLQCRVCNRRAVERYKQRQASGGAA